MQRFRLGSARLRALVLMWMLTAVFGLSQTQVFANDSGAGFDSPASNGVSFQHVATAASITACGSSYCTQIDHPLTNNNPNALLFITPTRFVNGAAIIVSNDNPIGVSYVNGHWRIFNQNIFTAMTEGAGFNVKVASADPNHFMHTATAGNTFNGSTRINHVLANGNQNAVILVTQNFSGGVFNIKNVGVSYDNVADVWVIANTNGSAVPAGATFNVQVIPVMSSVVFTHVALAGTIPGATPYLTVLDYAALNGNSDWHIQVTPVRVLSGGGYGPFNDFTSHLRYTQGEWRVSNLPGNAMAEGAGFNIVVVSTSDNEEQLLNGSFEVQSANAKTPAAWKVTKVGGGGADPYARRLCTPDSKPPKAYDGRCMFQFKGFGKYHLTQKLPSVAGLKFNDVVILSARVRGKNIKAGGVAMRLIVTYPGGSKQNIKVPAGQINAGTYGYKLVQTNASLNAAPSKIVLKVSWNGKGGWLRLDSVSVGYTIFSIAGSDSLISVPAAPGQ